MIPTPEGVRIAPPRPKKAHMRMKIVASLEKAVINPTTPVKVVPTRKHFRLPKLSARPPPEGLNREREREISSELRRDS